jgi:antitoxin HicB
MKENQRTLEYYMGLSYSIEVIRDSDDENPGWVARVKELPGCITQADSFEELEGMIRDALRSWIEVALEDGIPIPEPRFEEDYSGKFVIRLPKSLHRELVEQSEQEGVSLNTWVIQILAKSVGTTSQSITQTKIEQLYRQDKDVKVNRIIADKGKMRG